MKRKMLSAPTALQLAAGRAATVIAALGIGQFEPTAIQMNAGFFERQCQPIKLTVR
jgi:hypothetical protein